MKSINLCVALFVAAFSFAQNKPFKISGTIFSEADNAPLESATVYLQRVKDSALITYTISGRDGKFMLEGKSTHAETNLFISYVGYQTHFQSVKITKELLPLGTINLKVNANALQEVVIKSQAPITIKKDTMEFNVKSFKTKKDANIEDLLKELPGVEIDEEGKIKVNGKEVNKILVNGKPFFGNDPTITTRNLTKDIVEKIQILDTKTKDQAFTGETADGENKTVNLVIKEENNKGVFGRIAAGAGTDAHYEFAGMFNRFDNDQRISVLAGGNDINSPGFSFGEIRKMFGGGNNVRFSSNGSFTIDGRSFGGGQGITESQNLGANYADELAKGKDVSGNYFYSGSTSENKTSRNRENILADRRYFTSSESRSFSDNDNHNANLEFDIELDSTLLINVKPSFNYSKNRTIYDEDEKSLDEFQTLTNQSTTDSNVETIGKNFNNDIDITKRFGSKGAFLKFSVENELSRNETDDFLNSETTIFGDNANFEKREQFTDGEKKVTNVESDVTYRMPLIANKFFLDFRYRYRRNKQEDRKSTFDKDDITGDFSNFNTNLSTDFEYLNETKTPSLRFDFNNKTWSASFQSSYVFKTLENTDRLRPLFSISRNFEAIELRSRLRYRMNEKASFSMGYSLNNDSPQLAQLQQYENISNPLNTIVGNPNLEAENNHDVYINYNAFDFQKGSGYYGYISANFENNKVVSKSEIDENLIRRTTYVNVNGSYNLNGYISANKKIKLDSLRTATVYVGLGPNVSRAVNFNNGIQYASTNTSLSPNLGFRLIWKDVMEFSPRYRLSFTKSTFDIDNFKNQEFINHSLNFNTATFLPKGFEWRNDIQFNYNPNIAAGFQKSAWFWNATLAYSVLKDQGTVTLKAYDLLNQNTNARRIATENYIQDSQSTVLQQYFMLSFSWKFNSLGKAGETEDGRFYRH